jgi:hypothetical protein
LPFSKCASGINKREGKKAVPGCYCGTSGTEDDKREKAFSMRNQTAQVIRVVAQLNEEAKYIFISLFFFSVFKADKLFKTCCKRKFHKLLIPFFLVAR